jgi:hypothetical protein
VFSREEFVTFESTKYFPEHTTLNTGISVKVKGVYFLQDLLWIAKEVPILKMRGSGTVVSELIRGFLQLPSATVNNLKYYTTAFFQTVCLSTLIYNSRVVLIMCKLSVDKMSLNDQELLS